MIMVPCLASDVVVALMSLTRHESNNHVVTPASSTAEVEVIHRTRDV